MSSVRLNRRVAGWPEGLREFVGTFGVEVRTYSNGERIILYKAVREEFQPWHDAFQAKEGTRPYEPGRCVKTRTFSSNRYSTCGRGLHITPLQFVKLWVSNKSGKNAGYATKIVEVAIEPKNIVVPAGVTKSIGRAVKVRARELIVLREVPLKELEGKHK